MTTEQIAAAIRTLTDASTMADQIKAASDSSILALQEADLDGLEWTGAKAKLDEIENLLYLARKEALSFQKLIYFIKATQPA